MFTRVVQLLERFLIRLGMVLLFLSPLLVPETAFGDEGEYCASFCGDAENWQECMENCCAEQCALLYEPTSPEYGACTYQCQFGGCPGNSCEDGNKCGTQQSGACDKKNTYCNAQKDCSSCICRNVQQACYCRAK